MDEAAWEGGAGGTKPQSLSDTSLQGPMEGTIEPLIQDDTGKEGGLDNEETS